MSRQIVKCLMRLSSGLGPSSSSITLGVVPPPSKSPRSNPASPQSRRPRDGWPPGDSSRGLELSAESHRRRSGSPPRSRSLCGPSVSTIKPRPSSRCRPRPRSPRRPAPEAAELRATGTDHARAVAKKVPTVVPRGAEIGAVHLAQGTYEAAPECTDEGARRVTPVSRHKSLRNGALRTTLPPDASLCIGGVGATESVPATGFEPVTLSSVD